MKKHLKQDQQTPVDTNSAPELTSVRCLAPTTVNGTRSSVASSSIVFQVKLLSFATLTVSALLIPFQKSADPEILVFGSLAIDLSCDYCPKGEGTVSPSTDVTPHMHTSNIATITPSLGGVGHNVALAAHRAIGQDTNVKLCSVVARDMLVLLSRSSYRR